MQEEKNEMSGASQAAFVLFNLRDRAATAAARCFPADWEECKEQISLKVYAFL